MKKSIKRTLNLLALFAIIAIFGNMMDGLKAYAQTANNVPEHYYANYKFDNSWRKIFSVMQDIQDMYDTNSTIDNSKFIELNHYFNKSFPHLTEDFKSTYNKCSIYAKRLAEGYRYEDLKALLGNSCYKDLSIVADKITSSYTVKAIATANPVEGMAPLTVTFDARGSIDPSSETIPKDNYFRYYRDENGVDTPMGKGNVINYSFKEAGKFIVHLVVRSSNVDKGILDGEMDLTINVSPKAANIVVYANTRRMYPDVPLKIGVTEGEKGVIFDGSATMARGGRVIKSHQRTITNQSAGFSYTWGGDGLPSYQSVPLNYHGEYKITLTTVDNEKNKVSETFYLHISDPVTVIKQSPEKGTTSTLYTFDGGASYSIRSRLTAYLWEIFNAEGNKIATEHGKSFSHKFKIPGNYGIKLTVTDSSGETNVDKREILVESTTPKPQFTVTPTKRRAKPSEFTLDASNSSDVDVMNDADSLEYNRTFSTNSARIVSTEKNNERVVVQFDEKGKHKITLTVIDQYGKSATISKTIDVLSTLRPEIIPTPAAISRGRTINFSSEVNEPVNDYSWDFGDKKTLSHKDATTAEHIYAQKGVYEVKLTVSNSNDSNTVTERVFIGEVDYPITAYKIRDNQGFLLNASDICDIEGSNGPQNAYEIDRQAKFTIDPSISVNTQGKSAGLSTVYEFVDSPTKTCKDQLCSITKTFKDVGCRYIDLGVQDGNSGKQDKTRIWFNVKNAQPTIKNVMLSFPQYSDDTNSAGSFSLGTSSNRATFDCSGTNNLTIKVTAVNASDTDGNISRYRFYYYNVDDPDRILEYKDSLMSSPYAYFVIPRISGEYKFGVMIYDNDGGMTNSDEYLGSSPSVNFPASCDSADVPTVTLKLSSTNVEVGDTVTYTIVSKIDSNNEDFETSRTFYYDFTGDGTWDLVTKKSSATYTFTEAYEDGVQPRAAVEYRNKLGKGEGARIFVKNGVKPILLYNTYKNVAIFRDLSVGVFQQREICFEKEECEKGNKRYRKINIITSNIDSMTGGTQTDITRNDSFLWRYSNLGKHEVSLFLKSKFGISDSTVYDLNTSNNTSNGRIAPGVNMITIPETTFTNKDPEIFLSKAMKNVLLMYIANENDGDACYVDIDISKDSNGDGITDNDNDLVCNTMGKVTYEPNYDSIIGRIYFIHDGKLVFQNYYVSFEGYVLEYGDEDLELYNDITILVNGIDEVLGENAALKSSLDVLRKNLKNRNLVSSTIMTIKTQMSDGGLNLDAKQKDLLSDIINRLSNDDTVVAVGMNAYDKNKQEILVMLYSTSFKSDIEGMFSDFEKNVDSYDPERKAQELKNIFNAILTKGKAEKALDNADVLSVIEPAFCNIFDYYDVSSYTEKCSSDQNTDIIKNYENGASEIQKTTKKLIPSRLKILLIVLGVGILIMGGIIVFFAIRARKSSVDEEE